MYRIHWKVFWSQFEDNRICGNVPRLKVKHPVVIKVFGVITASIPSYASFHFPVRPHTQHQVPRESTAAFAQECGCWKTLCLARWSCSRTQHSTVQYVLAFLCQLGFQRWTTIFRWDLNMENFPPCQDSKFPIPLFPRYILIFLAVWQDAPSYCKMQVSLANCI